MFCRRIEFRPYRNHHPPMHGMNGIDHLLRIRETQFVKLMTSPCVFRPMIPVEHNIVNRNPAVTETFQRSQHILLCVIFLTALPISHRPFWHNRRFPRQCTITADHFIHVIAGHEIIVQLRSHLTPPRLFALFFRVNRAQHAQSRIRNGAIGDPLHL